MFAEIADFIIDLWTDKIINRFSSKNNGAEKTAKKSETYLVILGFFAYFIKLSEEILIQHSLQ